MSRAFACVRFKPPNTIRPDVMRAAAAQLEPDIVERAHDPAAGAEFNAEIGDLEQGDDVAAAHVRIRGSAISRKPSPIRLKQNTVAISTMPGKNAIHHSPEMMKLAP